MCRMIAVVAREPVSVAPFLDELAVQSRKGVESPHGDGFGAAIFTGEHWLHVREQCPVWEAALAELGKLRGTVMLLHARKASDPSSINLTKLHPFCWPGQGRGLMFCQNGTIRRHQNLQCRLDAGAIDTEKYFSLVIHHYQESQDLAEAVNAAVQEIEECDADATALNCFVSDGRELVAYKGRILPENKCYHLLFVHEEPGLAIVSTEPFRDGKWGPWRALEGVFRAGFS